MAHRVRLGKSISDVVVAGHPWIWRDALSALEAPAGEIVHVYDGRGRFVAVGFADEGPIGVRVLSSVDEPIDAGFVARRIGKAAALRDRVRPPDTDCYRLLAGEGDRLPGVVCDVYGSAAVVKLDGAGVLALRAFVEAALAPVLRERGVTSAILRGGRRGSERSVEVLFGTLPSAPIEVREHGMTLLADVVAGQKTGLFLDHRESRKRVRGLARGLRVLNLYGYTGGFSVAAALGGAARVETVDVAPAAIALAHETWARNGLPAERHAAHAEDVPAFLSRAPGPAWDVIVADPPSFAPNEASLEGALASYTKLHVACLGALARDGLYLAASCSSHVRREAFERTLAEAARRTGRTLQVLDRWGAPPDHPHPFAFPEGDYLKVILVRAAD